MAFKPHILDTTFFMFVGEVGLLLWASVMCYQARLAPALYNDSTYIGMAVWNHLIWIVNSTISRFVAVYFIISTVYALNRKMW